MGNYKWHVSSASGGSIDDKGVYKAGAKAGTDVVTVIDSAHGNSSAMAEVNVSPIWPMVYEKMWDVKKGEKLSLLRTFRDEVLANSELGRDYIHTLYASSLEILILLFQDPSLMEEIRMVIDEILPEIRSALDGSKMVLSKKQLDDIESLFSKFEAKACPAFKTAIRKVRKDINPTTSLMDFF